MDQCNGAVLAQVDPAFLSTLVSTVERMPNSRKSFHLDQAKTLLDALASGR